MLLIRWLRAITSYYPLNSPRAAFLRVLPNPPTSFGPFRGKRGLRFIDYWNTNDSVSKSLFWFGDFDPWVNLALRRLAEPGSTVLDIGANIGATVLVLASRVGPKGKVICFEPMPSTLQRLTNNVEANGFKQVEIISAALSDKPGILHMVLPDQAGQARVTTAAEKTATHQVPALVADDWLREHPQKLISVCKIDVEGHEPEVLAGMSETLAGKIIQSFVFERHIGPEVKSDPVLDLLRYHGYAIYRIEKGLHKIVFVPIDHALRLRPTRDFAAVLPGSAAEKRLLA